jgi:WXG100 family type VII secretion target
MDHLNVDVEQAFSAAHAISNDAVDLQGELTALERDWENLSSGWTGAAASAYLAAWTEWHDGATTLVDSLSDLAQKVGHAAADYAEQDASSGSDIDAAALDLGL